MNKPRIITVAGMGDTEESAALSFVIGLQEHLGDDRPQVVSFGYSENVCDDGGSVHIFSMELEINNEQGRLH